MMKFEPLSPQLFRPNPSMSVHQQNLGTVTTLISEDAKK